MPHTLVLGIATYMTIVRCIPYTKIMRCEVCYTNPLSPDFKPDTYQCRMLYLIHNRIEIPSYM